MISIRLESKTSFLFLEELIMPLNVVFKTSVMKKMYDISTNFQSKSDEKIKIMLIVKTAYNKVKVINHFRAT